MSSRKLLTLLDGLSPDSWYKQSVTKFIEDVREEEDRKYRQDIKGLIFAQLTGQTVTTEE